MSASPKKRLPSARGKRRPSASQNASRPEGGSRRIVVKGARVHNLKNVSLELPRNTLVVMTGVSGSGKSSLAFDTIYAEGQRRYVESLSSYARQFLERMDKPDVDVIQGISPAIAIEQKTGVRNPRSTVATTTELYDYLRLLFGRIGRTICPHCGSEVRRDSVSTIVDRLLEESEGTRFYVLFPMHDHPGRTMAQELDALTARGFFRIVVKDRIVDLHETAHKGRSKKGVHVLVDRLVVRRNDPEMTNRLADSLETALGEGDGHVKILFPDEGRSSTFSSHFECRNDGTRFEEPDPRLFSFNNPVGACPKCQGFGRSVGIDMNLVVPDPSKSIKDGAIHPWNFPRWRQNLRDLLKVSFRAGIPIDVPFKDLTAQQHEIIMNGFQEFDGIQKFFKYIERKSYKVHYRVFLSRYRGYTTCDECQGSRLRTEALNIRVGDKTIHDLVRMTIDAAQAFFLRLTLSAFERDVARRILEEINKRLKFLVNVGLGYLTLDRLSMTLSGGEAQRINLATSLGSSLVGALYVLDEPSIGLHPRDNERLIGTLKNLRDIGNTVLVVEHDETMIRSADIVVDMGPKAGEHGGEVVFSGPLPQLLGHPSSLTARYLSGRASIPVPKTRRRESERSVFITGASEHNLKSIDLRIPLGMFVCVTGVSGSGKSTLVHDILYAGIQKSRGAYEGTPGRCTRIEGAEALDHLELVDQSPIGRTPRSNPTTYIKAFDLVRELLARTPAAKIHGFAPGHFSFNVPGGRCETCEGDGVQRIEMQFLADLYLPCESCKGKRFKKEVLEIRYRGKNVDDILGMTVTEAIEFFGASAEGKRVAKRLSVLDEVGLGYLRLGQPATSLSGGEAQRIKLASHLAASHGEGTILFIFDEPTTGLHFDDIAKLLKCFDALLEQGHSLVVIEHNMDVVKCADWIIDLGPEGGEEGGSVVALGRPEDLARRADSHTGKFLKAVLGR